MGYYHELINHKIHSRYIKYKAINYEREMWIIKFEIDGMEIILYYESDYIYNIKIMDAPFIGDESMSLYGFKEFKSLIDILFSVSIPRLATCPECNRMGSPSDNHRNIIDYDVYYCINNSCTISEYKSDVVPEDTLDAGDKI